MLLNYEIFIENEYLGSMQAFKKTYSRGGYYSVAVACPDCGDIWARVFTPGHKTYFAVGHCAKHVSISLDGGSLVNQPSLSEFYNSWPLAVWQRELRLWAEGVGDWEPV